MSGQHQLRTMSLSKNNGEVRTDLRTGRKYGESHAYCFWIASKINSKGIAVYNFITRICEFGAKVYV